MRVRVARSIKGGDKHDKVTLYRRDVQYLLRVVNEAARQAVCRVNFQGKPVSWTCLDTLAEAAKLTSNYMPEYRAEILTGSELCPACKLRAALGE